MKKGLTVRRSSRERKYFAPQNQGNRRKCDCPGCEKDGEYRAPKDRSLRDYYWFCLEHVQAYNAGWNYYEGETPEEPQFCHKPDMHFNNFGKNGYRWKDDFGFFKGYADGFAAKSEVYFNAKEREFLQILELSPEEANRESLKKQYKKLAKKYHPDLNRGDKNAEEKFKQLMIAYHSLAVKFS